MRIVVYINHYNNNMYIILYKAKSVYYVSLQQYTARRGHNNTDDAVILYVIMDSRVHHKSPMSLSPRQG